MPRGYTIICAAARHSCTPCVTCAATFAFTLQFHKCSGKHRPTALSHVSCSQVHPGGTHTCHLPPLHQSFIINTSAGVISAS